jgi:hypothetical protein
VGGVYQCLIAGVGGHGGILLGYEVVGRDGEVCATAAGKSRSRPGAPTVPPVAMIYGVESVHGDNNLPAQRFSRPNVAVGAAHDQSG